MDYCPNCGAKIEEDMSFCPECGLNLEEENSPNLPGSEREEGSSNRRGGAERGEKEGKTEEGLAEPIGLLIGGFVLITIGVFFNLAVTGALGGIVLWLLFFLTVGVLVIVALVVAVFTSIFLDFRENDTDA